MRKRLFEWLFPDSVVEINRISSQLDNLTRRHDEFVFEAANVSMAVSTMSSALNDLRNEFEAMKNAQPAPTTRVRTARNFSEFRNAAQARPRKES